MTIRTRLTVWYASTLLGSFLLMAAVLYFELVLERRWATAAGKPIDRIEEEIAEIILIYGVPTAIFTVCGGWWLLRKALVPLDKLATAAERLHIDNLHEPLPRTGNRDEVDRLSEILNATNRRLEEAFARIQEFTLHASHELKTPLAILQGEIEMFMADPSFSAAQREACASQLDEIQRLTKIVDGLTLLAKADAGKIVLSSELVRLDELVQECFADAQILAQQKNIQVVLLACVPVTLKGDRHRLRQLLLNLTENAIKYNVPNGNVEIALAQSGTIAELTIVNTGPGIPSARLSRVFDRFFRGDESHNSDTEGCGLGLSIAQWIVKAHDGEINIASRPEDLTRVTVSLPCEVNPTPSDELAASA